MPDARKLRVCVLTSVHPPTDTRVFYRQARSTVAAGHDVLLIAPNAPRDPIDGVRFASLPSWGGRLGRPVRWPVLFVEAIRARADVYHFHDPELLPWGVLLRWVTRKPVIYDSHEYLKEDVLGKRWIPAPLRKAVAATVSFIEGWCAGRLSAVVVVTEEMGDRFERLAKRTVLVRNLPPAPTFELPSERKPNVAYAGLMNVERGLDILYETACRVRVEVPQAEFHVLGPIEWDGVPERVTALSPDEWERAGVRFLGTVPPGDVAAITATATVGWLPRSPHYQNNLLAWPNKLVEYMVVGLAIVASDLPLQARVVKEYDCGVVVEALSPAAHARAICDLLRHPEEAARLGENGRRSARERLTWEAESTRLHTLYRDLAGSG